MVVVSMRDKNPPNVANLNTCLRKAARGTVASIYHIEDPMDYQKVGRLCPVRGGIRTTSRAERDELGALGS